MLKNKILHISLAVFVISALIKAALYINHNNDFSIKVNDLLSLYLSLSLLAVILIAALVHFICRIYSIWSSGYRNTTRKKVIVTCVSVVSWLVILCLCFVSSVIVVFTENTVEEYTVEADGTKYYVSVSSNFLDGGEPVYVGYFEYVNFFCHKAVPVTDFKCYSQDNPLDYNENFIPDSLQKGNLLSGDGSVITYD